MKTRMTLIKAGCCLCLIFAASLLYSPVFSSGRSHNHQDEELQEVEFYISGFLVRGRMCSETLETSIRSLDFRRISSDILSIVKPEKPAIPNHKTTEHL